MSSKIEVNFFTCNQPTPPISLPGLSFIFFTYFIYFICNRHSPPSPIIYLRLSSLPKMFIAAASACAVTMVRLLHSCEKYLQEPSSQKYLHRPPVKLPASLFRPTSISLNSPTPKYPFFPMAASPLIINQNPSATIIPPTAKHPSSRKVRILCRFGGKLLPGLSDGALHYVGGQTCITDFRRDTTLPEFNYKMEGIYGGPAVIRYKLSDQNQDSLVSILSTEDLDEMLDEYDYLLEAPGGRYTRLEVFLFPTSNRENSLTEFNNVACNDSIEVEDNMEGSTIDDEEGNDNTSVSPPYDMPFPFSMSLEDQPDPWNLPGPSNNASYFGQFRHTQDSGTNDTDEDFQNLIELVESVLQSP